MGGSPSAFTSRLSGLMLSVTPENVLRIRDTLKSELDRLQGDYDKHHVHASTLPELGPDPVSKQAKEAFGPKLVEVVDRFKRTIDDVRATVDALTGAALRYGIAEDDIASTMHGIGSDVSGARQLVSGLVEDQPTSVVGGAAPASNGLDLEYMRSALNPAPQVGRSR